MSNPYAGTFDETYGETEQEKIARMKGRDGGPQWAGSLR